MASRRQESRQTLEDTILNGYLNVTKTGTHITPQRVYDIIQKRWGWTKEEMFDPCPADYSIDGLSIPWKRRNYVNPEFDAETVRKFYVKTQQEMTICHESIMLLPSKTDMDWFHDIITHKYEIEWIRGRLKFEGEKWNAPGPHFLVKIGL